MATVTDPTAYNYSAPQGGGGDIKGNNPNFTDVAQTQNNNSQNFNQSQANQVGQFQGNYNAAAQALPTYQALNQQANQQYNVQPLMQNATNLNNRVLRLPSENYNLTAGSDTNQAQLDQMTGVQQFRLQPLAQNATAQAQQAQTLANQQVGYGVQNEAQMLSPYANTAPLVQSQMASAATNFGTQQANELAALRDKMAQGVSLTNTELQQKTALEAAQLNYNAAVNTAQASVDAANATNNRMQNISSGSYMYNPATGKYQAVGH